MIPRATCSRRRWVALVRRPVMVPRRRIIPVRIVCMRGTPLWTCSPLLLSPCIRMQTRISIRGPSCCSGCNTRTCTPSRAPLGPRLRTHLPRTSASVTRLTPPRAPAVLPQTSIRMRVCVCMPRIGIRRVRVPRVRAVRTRRCAARGCTSRVGVGARRRTRRRRCSWVGVGARRRTRRGRCSWVRVGTGGRTRRWGSPWVGVGTGGSPRVRIGPRGRTRRRRRVRHLIPRVRGVPIRPRPRRWRAIGCARRGRRARVVLCAGVARVVRRTGLRRTGVVRRARGGRARVVRRSGLRRAGIIWRSGGRRRGGRIGRRAMLRRRARCAWRSSTRGRLGRGPGECGVDDGHADGNGHGAGHGNAPGRVVRVGVVRVVRGCVWGVLGVRRGRVLEPAALVPASAAATRVAAALAATVVVVVVVIVVLIVVLVAVKGAAGGGRAGAGGALADTDVLADADFDTLVGKGAGETGRFWGVGQCVRTTDGIWAHPPCRGTSWQCIHRKVSRK